MLIFNCLQELAIAFTDENSKNQDYQLRQQVILAFGTALQE